jgi:hypothetical protein
LQALAVIGARAWHRQDLVWEYLDRVRGSVNGEDLLIVSGACPTGADAIAEAWAKKRGVPILLYPANWEKGRAAGFARNHLIVKASAAVAAFLSGPSRGTMNSIRNCLEDEKESPRLYRGTASDGRSEKP